MDHNHDDDDDDDDDDESIPSLEEASHGFQAHNLLSHPQRGFDDPDEDDISTMRFQSVGPGRYHLSATISRSFSPSALGQNDNGPSTIDGFATFLTHILHGPRHRQVGAGTDAPGGAETRSAPDSAETRSAPGGAETRSGRGTPQVRRFTYNSGAQLHPRDGDHPEPRLEPVDDISK